MNSAKIKLLVGAVLIAGGVSYIGYLAVQDSGNYALDVKQYAAAPEKWKGRGLRIDGISVEGSWLRSENHHTFKLSEKTDKAIVVPVAFDGTMPDTFREGTMVIAEGKFGEDGTFHATNVYPQCASKYEGVPESYKHEHDGKVVPIFKTDSISPRADAGKDPKS